MRTGERPRALLRAVNKDKPVLPGLIIQGETIIQRNVVPTRSLAEPLQVAMDNF